MRRNQAQQIGLLIRKFIRQEGLESPLNQQRLLMEWNRLLGPMANYTKDLRVHNQTLYAHVTSSALRQELTMERKRLMDALNNRVGSKVITNIVIR